MKVSHTSILQQAKLQKLTSLILSVMIFCLYGCKKIKSTDDSKKATDEIVTSIAVNATSVNSGTCVEDLEAIFTADSVLKSTILGAKLN
jgi:hypothetical protein